MGNYDDDRDRGGRRSSGGDLRPLEVHVDGDNVERALRTLKRKMAEEGIFRELKKRRFYEKPSEARKRKSAEATRRRRKAERKLRTGR